ncbi:MAG: hypothetical protein E4G89_02540 [Methanothrix sp.]|nr:MAG: hypothetical protein E4G89_02540 [Methanothrix sp.]
MKERDEYRMSGVRSMENTVEEGETRERSEYFWHTYYGFPSELVGWVLLVVSLLYFAFVASVALGIL